jgi:DNA-binding GntR family transcriptional regulator
MSAYPSIDMSAGRTQATQLVARLRRDIVAGVLAPGAKLKISDLAARYGVGVIPTREALSRLASSGLVVAEDQRGFRVAPVSLDELRDLASLRRTLETRALRESLQHGDVEWEAQLIAAHHRLSRLPPRADGSLGYDETWDAAHMAFHFALLDACRSRWLMQFVHVLSEQMNRYRHVATGSDTEHARDVGGEHASLLQAALERDADRACALLDEHFSVTEADARRALQERGTR